MFKATFASLLVATSCALAVAKDPGPLPADVPPVIGTAVATPSSAEDDDQWSIKLVVPKVAWEVFGEKRPKLEWPKFNVTVKEATLTLQMGYHPATQLSDNAQNRLLDLKGRRLSRDEALNRLAAKTPVLVSVSGRMPDPFYLQFTKPDTLIVMLGIPTAPSPELLPQPRVANNAEKTKHSLALANETAEPESKEKQGDKPDAKQPKQKTQAIEVFVDLSLGLCDEQTAKKRLETLKAKNLKAALEAEIEATEGDLLGIRQVTGQQFVALTRLMEIVSSGMSVAALGVSRDRAYLEVNVFLTSHNRYVAVVTTELAGLPKEVVDKLKK